MTKKSQIEIAIIKDKETDPENEDKTAELAKLFKGKDITLRIGLSRELAAKISIEIAKQYEKTGDELIEFTVPGEISDGDTIFGKFKCNIFI